MKSESNRPIIRLGISATLFLTLLVTLTPVASPAFAGEDTGAPQIRFATYNASLNRDSQGQLVEDLSTPDDAQAQAVAEIIQINRPDVLLINEFDFDEDGLAAQLFQENYLSVSQNGAEPIEYGYVFVAPSNTGVASGFDLNNDDIVGDTIETFEHADDALGFGLFPGQYGMVVFSKYPIDEEAVRTFQTFLWKDMPDGLLPDNPDTAEPADYYSPEELEVFRLSSKSHWDVPIIVGKETIHFLVSHPTPPVFDGPEDRNGTRNHDEIRFWADYIDPAESDYIYDDQGNTGGLPEGAFFVIAGDQNADPLDGDSTEGAIQQLLDSALVNTEVTPSSEGGPEQAELQGIANETHQGDPASDTADFSDDPGPGNVRVDYVLPSLNLLLTDAGVFWPTTDDALYPLVENSDHRLVWVDVEAPGAAEDAMMEADGPAFTLTVLHNNDGESKLLSAGADLEDFGGAARFASVVRQEKQNARLCGGDETKSLGECGVVLVSSGDNFLAGPEFNASLEAGEYFDAIAMDLFGYDAIAIGNHDFDFGPEVLADYIQEFDASEAPFLSANLDYSGEPDLQALLDIGRIARSVVVNTQGEDIGIIGATTPNLRFISSPRNVVVASDVAAAVQAEIDALEEQGVNKIILISHLQDIDGDVALAGQLDGVDIMVAGGGDEMLANEGNPLIPGDEIVGPYPRIAEDAEGNEVPVVTTAGNYKYLGRLAVEFDADGNVIGFEGGPVRVAGGEEPDAVSPKGSVQRAVVDPVIASTASLAENVIATSEVDLDGVRNQVRSVETNQGNLIADALLWQATELAEEFGVPAPDVAIQNGGGIRNDSVVPAGPITELDTFAMVPFPNFVTVLEDISREQFKDVMENAVSRIDPPAAEGGSGRFAQIAGFSFEYDPAGTPMLFAEDGSVVEPGARVVSVVLDDGTVIVEGGSVVSGDDLTVVTIDFLARGGDEYPYGDAPFTALGVSYQQALANYIAEALEGEITAADYPEGGEGRITQLP
jgi:5'-nucleotidase